MTKVISLDNEFMLDNRFENLSFDEIMAVDGGDLYGVCKVIVEAVCGAALGYGVSQVGKAVGGTFGTFIGGPVGTLAGGIVGWAVGSIVSSVILTK
jgi:hypothetical protein